MSVCSGHFQALSCTSSVSFNVLCGYISCRHYLLSHPPRDGHTWRQRVCDQTLCRPGRLPACWLCWGHRQWLSGVLCEQCPLKRKEKKITSVKISNSLLLSSRSQTCSSCCEGDICNMLVPRNESSAVFSSTSPLSGSAHLLRPAALSYAAAAIILPAVVSLWAARISDREARNVNYSTHFLFVTTMLFFSSFPIFVIYL